MYMCYIASYSVYKICIYILVHEQINYLHLHVFRLYMYNVTAHTATLKQTE